MAFAEIKVPPSTPMPNGYKLLKKGYPFMTALCRRKTQAAGQKLYVVQHGSTVIGLRAPKRIVNEAYEEERQTRASRRAAVATRDDAARSTFRAAVDAQFPEMPAEDAEKVVQRALKKRSGRVGRTGTLDLRDKVRLAVAAHVRHIHTDYDALVRGARSRDEARREVYDRVREVLGSWEAKGENRGRTGKRGMAKKIRRNGNGEASENSGARGSRGLESPSRQSTVRTRAMTRRASEGMNTGDGAGDVPRSSLDDPILISSDSEDESMDVLIISSDEE